MLDRPQVDQSWFPGREISPCPQFSGGPGAHELFANRQCLSECGEPWSCARSLRRSVRIEFCLDDPELHETVQLVWRQRTAATTWEQIVLGLFTGVGNPLFKCFCGYLGQTAPDGWSSPFL